MDQRICKMNTPIQLAKRLTALPRTSHFSGDESIMRLTIAKGASVENSSLGGAEMHLLN